MLFCSSPQRIALFLAIVAGLCLPLTLLGQDAQTSSIIGQSFKHCSTPPDYPVPSMIWSLPEGTQVTLIADGDTLRTEMEKFGIFTFSGIKSRRVFLDVTGSIPEIMHYSGILELMPGENILLINHEDYAPAFGAIPVITEQGDNWVYEYPGILGEGIYVADKLKDLPGATFNRRKGTISVPSKGIYRAKVGNAYIFALKPDTLSASE